LGANFRLWVWVVLKIRFKDDVPVEATCVPGREPSRPGSELPFCTSKFQIEPAKRAAGPQNRSKPPLLRCMPSRLTC